MLSEQLTVSIDGKSDELWEAVNHLIIEQTDTDQMRVLIPLCSDYDKIVNDFSKRLNIAVLEPSDTVDHFEDSARQCKTPYLCSISSEARFEGTQNLYNMLVQLKSSGSRLVVPKLILDVNGITDAVTKKSLALRYHSKLKQHPYSPSEFLFGETEEIMMPGGFNKSETLEKQMLTLFEGVDQDRLAYSDESIWIPNGYKKIANYFELIKSLKT